ncbi:MAG TPA: enediyne biosynthesis protein [Pseudonocardiaceae bacterium]|nr:enediyne biosynthesis protein [Pseudonocardiaceae bacterium]
MTATIHPAPVPAPAAAGKTKAKPDPRYIALRNFAMSITAFNIFGYTLLGFEQPWLWPILAVIVGYTAEITFEIISAWAYQRQPRFRGNGFRGLYEFLLPAHITAIAVNMLTYANNQFWPVAFGVVVGVGAKHVLQAPVAGRMRHFMNPSNFGITAVLLCFSTWASIAPPYEFSENANTYWRVMIPVVIATAGTTINAVLTRKVPLIVGWMGGFAIQGFVRHWIWHVSLYSALGPMTGIAFVLFTNYMISDPGTTPFKARPQFMFGASVAFVYAVLMLFNVVYTLFFAVCIVCAVRGAGWWVAHLVGKAKQKRVTPAERPPVTELPAAA